MDFFEHQHRARRKTGMLVVYFVLAVVMIIVSLNIVILLFLSGATSSPTIFSDWLQQPYWVWISVGVLIAIGIGTISTIVKLRGGGRVVAEMVGARRIAASSQDTDERRLINVVEEMSIASGTPMPALYVLEEPAINAFVAGYRPTEAVLVVTRGTLQHLTRDELQGVIGHEYSHIFNGDMRINIRLMGILSGILIISQFGRILMYSNRRSRGKGAGQAAMLGLALFIIGYVGIFFGSLIKAAVSRQRELLADAASVQFTRNPDGIAGALWKIKLHSEGSLLTNSHSDDVSHFCFGEAVKFRLSSLMATHPPLEQRIKAINPRFIGSAYAASRETDKVSGNDTGKISVSSMPEGAKGFAGNTDVPISTSTTNIVDSVGIITRSQHDYAANLHSMIPVIVHDALHTQEGACHIVYTLLLLSLDKPDQSIVANILRKEEGEQIREPLQALYRSIAAFGRHHRLTLLNLSFPALKEMDADKRRDFLRRIEAIIKSDGKVNLFEFVVYSLLKEHLSGQAEQDIPIKYFNYAEVQAELQVLISLMIQSGSSPTNDKAALYQRVISTFMFDKQTEWHQENIKVETIDQALQKLASLSPLLKKSVLEACVDCVLHDGKVSPTEAELLQLVAEMLDCPMPPLQTSLV